MYALSFISTLLILLAVVTYAKLERSVDEEMIHQSLRGHMEASRDLSNQWEKQTYELKVHTNRKRKKSATIPQKKASSEKTVKGPPKPKLQPLPDFPSKLNLAPAILPDIEPNTAHLFRNVSVQLMETLYKEEEWFHPEWAMEILETIAHKLSPIYIKRNDEFQGEITLIEELGAIDLDEPHLQIMWTNILQGKTGAYPSLLDFALFRKKGKEKINIAQAPLLLLEALLGPLTPDFAQKRQALIESYEKQGEDDALGTTRTDLEKQLKGAFNELLIGHEPLADRIKPITTISFKHDPGTLVVDASDQKARKIRTERDGRKHNEADRPERITLHSRRRTAELG